MSERGRLLTFEVGTNLYALPIASVAEVTEVGHVAAVPTLPITVAGVTNHHGDALPVLERSALFPVEGELAPPRQLLVLANDPEDQNRYGLPVDSVQGLVDGEGGTAHGDDAVAERRPMDGRILSVLDPKRLLAQAVETIQRSARGEAPAAETTYGGGA